VFLFYGINRKHAERCNQTGHRPTLWRSPEASDLQDPVAEVRSGSFVEHRARTEAAVPATSGAQRGAFLQSVPVPVTRWIT